jgi:hypothetical protein
MMWGLALDKLEVAVKVLDKRDEHKAEGKNLWQMILMKKRPKEKSVNARAHHAALQVLNINQRLLKNIRQSTHERIT